jgi:hypothetical protein
MIALAIDALKVAGLGIERSAKAVSHWLSKRSGSGVRIRAVQTPSGPMRRPELGRAENLVNFSAGQGEELENIVVPAPGLQHAR